MKAMKKWVRSLAKEVESDIKAAKKMWLPWWAVLCVMIGALPIYFLFDHFGRLNMALPTLDCLAVFALLVDIKWKLRRHVWFWITMAVIAALHAPLILFVPWTDRWVPAVAYAGGASVDLYGMLWILAAVGSFMEGPETAERD